MNRHGFSLVELLVVMAIMGTLLGLVTFGFTQYSKKSQIESQTKQLYGNLMEYRVKSLYEKKEWTFKITGTSYGIYSSRNTSVSPVTTTQFKHPIEYNSATNIIFDSQGLANVSGKSVCVAAESGATVDAVVISQSRVQIGKKRAGTNCDDSNVDAK